MRYLLNFISLFVSDSLAGEEEEEEEEDDEVIAWKRIWKKTKRMLSPLLIFFLDLEVP